MSDLKCQVPHQIAIFTELDFSIKEFEIMKAIKSLKRNKPPGLLLFWGNTKIVFTPTGKTALPGKDIIDNDP